MRTTTQRRSSEISFPFPHLRRLSLARRVVESWWSMAVVVVVDGSRGGGCGRDVVCGCCVVAQRRGHAAWTCLLQMTHGCREKILESEDGEHTRRVG